MPSQTMYGEQYRLHTIKVNLPIDNISWPVSNTNEKQQKASSNCYPHQKSRRYYGIWVTEESPAYLQVCHRQFTHTSI